jgi:hypothetical protein
MHTSLRTAAARVRERWRSGGTTFWRLTGGSGDVFDGRQITARSLTDPQRITMAGIHFYYDVRYNLGGYFTRP